MFTCGSPFKDRIAELVEDHLGRRLPDAPLDATVREVLATIEDQSGGDMLPDPHRQSVGECLEVLLLCARAQRLNWPKVGSPN